MTTPASMSELSTTAASNNPAGSDAPSTIDDQIRALASIVRQNVTKGSDIASASAITIPASGNYFVVTGTTGITSITDTNSWYGREVVLKFSGALTITHSANLILPGATNITTVAGDVLHFVSESSGVWRCSSYTKYSGTYAILGANTFTGLQTWKASADIASAATVDLTAATGNTTRITGTTATSAFTMTAGQWHMCIADGAWPLTYHATTNKLNTGSASYTCSAGDRVLLHKDDDNIIQACIIPTSGRSVSGETVQLTAQATTSGTYKDFTIPAGVNRIVIFFVGFSTNGTNVPLVQLGDSGGVENTGYTGAATITSAGATAAAAHSGGYYLASSWAASAALSGAIQMEHYGGNYWMIGGVLARDDVAATHAIGGWKSLTSELTTIRITSVGATDTLDAGAVNVSYQK